MTHPPLRKFLSANERGAYAVGPLEDTLHHDQANHAYSHTKQCCYVKLLAKAETN
jgi:hypothetical protein